MLKRETIKDLESKGARPCLIFLDDGRVADLTISKAQAEQMGLTILKDGTIDIEYDPMFRALTIVVTRD